MSRVNQHASPSTEYIKQFKHNLPTPLDLNTQILIHRNEILLPACLLKSQIQHPNCIFQLQCTRDADDLNACGELVEGDKGDDLAGCADEEVGWPGLGGLFGGEGRRRRHFWLWRSAREWVEGMWWEELEILCSRWRMMVRIGEGGKGGIYVYFHIVALEHPSYHLSFVLVNERETMLR